MKKNIFILPAILLILLSSCLNENKYETTPAVLVDRGMILNGTDTIGATYLVDEKKYCLDTIAVEDTLTLYVLFDAVGNNLTNAYIKYLNEFAELEVVNSDALADIVTPTISENSYSYSVVSGYRAIALQLQYVPQKAGTGELSFRVESDSEYSPAELKLLTPIREK